MIFVNITEGVAADGTRIHTVDEDGVNVVAVIGCKGVVLAAAAKHFGGTCGCNATALTRRGGDGVAVACKGGRQRMVARHIAESVIFNGARVHTINENRVNMVAIVRRDGHRKVISMQYCGNTGGSNTAAFASSCGDIVAVARESDLNGVVAANIAEGPAALHCHKCVIHCKGSDIATLFRRDDITLAAAAQHLGGAIRTDAAALASTGSDAVAIACKGSRQRMVARHIAERIAAVST